MSLSPQLEGLEGRRVEVVDLRGNKRRFWVRRNHHTAQIRIHLEVHNTRSMGGAPADMEYQSVRVVR